MRRAFFAGLSLLVLLGGATALLVRDEDRAPLPPEENLRAGGFAVWPEDTLVEGMAACEEAKSWRLDPKETAFRFAREVLHYPEPGLNTNPITDEERETNQIRYLIGSRGVRGVFLGSVIDVRRHDRCWFVVHLEPREGGWLPTIGFLHGDDGVRLLLRMEGPQVEIGYGGWQRQIPPQRGQVVLDLPEVERDVTGHIMALDPYRQVLDGSASPLGFIPEPAAHQVTRVGLQEVLDTPRVCGDDAYRRPLRAIADLYRFTLASDAGTRGQKVFQRGEGPVHAGGGRWLLHVDEVELAARIPQLEDDCHRILFIEAEGRSVLESVHVELEWVTLDLNWREARSAEILLISASGRGGSATGTFDRVDGPLTLRIHDRLPPNEPFYVTVVLRDGRKIVAAERRWYRT